MNKYVEGYCYLILRGCNTGSRVYPNWVLGSFNVRKSKPNVASNEVALKLSLKLPVALFEKPLLAATINIDADVPMIDLSPETITNIQDLIRSTAGLDVELTILSPEDN